MSVLTQEGQDVSTLSTTARPVRPGTARVTMTRNSSIVWWRTWVSQHRLLAAIVAGVVATHIATITGFWYPAIGLPQLDWNRVNGGIYTPEGDSLVRFISGTVYHYIDGVVFTIMYAVAIHPRLPWRNTALGNLAKGLVFGWVLTTISVSFMVPRVYFPHLDPGILSLNLGWQRVLAGILWHSIFGLHLGTVYSPLPDEAPTADGATG